MERETSGFDGWLRTVECVTREMSFVSALDAVSRLVGQAFGARIWFVDVLGRRWSYVAGETGDQPSQSALACIRLNGSIGLVSDTWGTISESERAKLIAFLEKFVASRQRS